jgi:hypothetical protein
MRVAPLLFFGCYNIDANHVFCICVQELKVAGMMPPLPENFPVAPDNEVLDSESDLLPAQSLNHEAPEASEGQTCKHAQSLSESSDALTPPTPRVPSFLERHGEDDGASSAPITAMPVRAMAPQPPAKKKKRKKEKALLVFNLSDIDSHSSEGSLAKGTQEAVGESKPTAPPSHMVADSEDDAPNPSPRGARTVATQKTPCGPSKSLSEHVSNLHLLDF